MVMKTDNRTRETEDVSEFTGESVKVSGAFSNYRLISRHGPHCLGTVQRYDRLFFVKSLSPEFAGMSLYRIQLGKEFKMLLDLNHPGVVRVYEMAEIPGVGLSILMEYVAGDTLDRFMASKPPLQSRRRVADALVEAVGALHSRGVTHRDLKPSNIMVTRDRQVKIVDFGMSDTEDYALLKLPSGTRRYAAPEQLAPGYIPAPPCDVYALGRIISGLRPGGGYGAAVRKAVRKDPARRPSDAAAFARCVVRSRRRGIISCVVAGVMAVALAAVVIFRTGEPGEGTLAAKKTEAVVELSAEAVDSVADTGKSQPALSGMADVGNAVPSAEEKGADLYEAAILLKSGDIDRALCDRADAAIAGLRALMDDPEISREWRMEAAARYMGELDAEYASMVNPVLADMTDAGMSKNLWRRFSWDNLQAGAKRAELRAMVDSIAAK